MGRNHHAVNEYLPKNQGDARYSKDEQEDVCHVLVLRYADRQPGAYECDGGGDRNHGKGNPWTGVGFRRPHHGLGRCLAIPEQDPDPESDQSNHRARVLQGHVPRHGSQQRNFNPALQPNPAPPWPDEWVGKRVPDHVRGDTQREGKQDSHEPGRAAELEWSELAAQSLLHAAGQQGYDRPLDGGMKHPEREEGGREREFDEPGELVAQAPIVGGPNNVRKVWSHAADHERRPHQVQSAQRQRGGHMGYGEGHRVEQRQYSRPPQSHALESSLRPPLTAMVLESVTDRK